MKRVLSGLLAGAVALGGVAVSSSSAALVVDLRFSDGSKSKEVAAGTYTVDVWAQVTGANASPDESLLFLYGSVQSAQTNGGAIKSGTSGVTGTAGAGVFTQSPAFGQTGTVQNATADGVADWGTTTTTNANTIKYNSTVDGTGTTPATRDSAGGIDNDLANGVEFKVGSFTVTINAADVNSATNATTTFNWVKATGTFPTAHSHRVDGSSTATTSAAAYVSSSAANAISFTAVPEPTMLGLAGLAGLALRRRRQA